MDLLQLHHTALIIYENEEGLKQFSENLKVAPKELISMKPQQLINSACSSKFDVILSGVCAPHEVNHDATLLTAVLKAAKPAAQISLAQILQNEAEPGSNARLISQLKICGFVKISDKLQDVSAPLKQSFNIPEGARVLEVRCAKPSFEVGSSTRLQLTGGGGARAVWKLEEQEEESETIDPEQLLDEADLERPTAGLRVCSSTGRRKACKDCSCGLAEELRQEEQGAAVNKPAHTPASSCGSCYLGDAFRCATCPYLGMPAFKPGDKVQLTTEQLAADL